MKAFLLCSKLETTRLDHVARLEEQLLAANWQVERMEAIYPGHTKVPFLQNMIKLSQRRTGYALLPAEIGCLLGHRKIWRRIVAESKRFPHGAKGTHFLVLESDSQINDLAALTTMMPKLAGSGTTPWMTPKDREKNWDLFFWGAWLGHMKLLRSTRQNTAEWGVGEGETWTKPPRAYTVGDAFIKSVYCTYGYSLNAKAAAYLLQQTQKINYPIDQFKRFVQPGNIQIGGILPEIISGGAMGSYINQAKSAQWQRTTFLHLLDIKNNLICFFK